MILFTLVIILLNTWTCYGARASCNLNGDRCDFYGLKMSRDDYVLEVTSNNPNAVKWSHLEDSTVPVLASVGTICNALPNLERFHCPGVSVEEVKENAFQGCENLRDVRLHQNNIVKVEVNAFKGLSQLDTLYLNSNKLFDLNVEELLEYLPKLNRILLADNNFKCFRLAEILHLLQARNIQADASVWRERKRNYTPNKLNGIHCLSSSQWESELAMISAEQRNLVKPRTTTPQPTTTEKPSGTCPCSHETIETLTVKEVDQCSALQENLKTTIQSFETKVETVLKTQDEKISDIQRIIENFSETLRKQTQAQDTQIVKLQEKLESHQAKQNEMSSNLLSSLSKSMNLLEERLRELGKDLQRSQNEIRSDCYKIVEEKCSEDNCVTF